MTVRSEAQWEDALFPEASTLFESDVAQVLGTLDGFGIRNAREARSRGFIRVRAGRGRAPGLWVHKSGLDHLERMVDVISERRRERERRETTHDEAKRARIDDLLEHSFWIDDDERTSVEQRLEQLPVEALTAATVEAELVAMRFAHAVDGVQHTRVRGGELVVSGELEGTILGHPVVLPLPNLASFELPDQLVSLLIRAQLEVFRRELESAVSRVRVEHEAEFRRQYHEALAATEGVIVKAIATLGDDVATRDSFGMRLVSVAQARLHEPKRDILSGLPTFVERRARALVWTALANATRDRGRGWKLIGDDTHAAVSLVVSVPVALLGAEWTISTEHRKDLPKEIRRVFFQAPNSEVIDGIDHFVLDVQSAMHERLERAMLQISDVVRDAEAIPGLDIRALERVLHDELDGPGLKPRHALRRVLARVEDLKAKAIETRAVHSLLSKAHFSNYAAFFEIARSIQRRLVLYVGPTNSGKTYNALNALSEGESGVYLAPLRLLALEGQEELEKRGRRTSFLTGEERDILADARFVSSTIEMLNTTRLVDAVVIDEVQLLSDPDRGWAWSAAIIGAPAKTVIMTGSPDAVPLVQALANYLGEPLEIRALERYTPLSVLDDTVSLAQVEPGTALICFSRRDVLGLKEQLDARHAISVIYGNLSPQVRREEARRFRSGESTILIATDAIALGLNLPIKTVVFTTTWKWNGREEARLTPSEVRQIGGRAGRFGKHDSGYVGALSRSDLDHVRTAFRDAVRPIPAKAQVRPSLTHVEAMSEVLASNRLRDLLDLFRRRMRFDDQLLTAVVPDELLQLAALTDSFPLALEDKFTFACAPVDTRNMSMVQQYRTWMASYARGTRARIDRLPLEFVRRDGVPNPDTLFNAELRVKLLTVYAWLAYRYPKAFPDLVDCDSQRDALNEFIERTLRRKGRVRRCAQCGTVTPARADRALCERCERRSRRHRRR